MLQVFGPLTKEEGNFTAISRTNQSGKLHAYQISWSITKNCQDTETFFY
jgi:hypothetical protein